MTAAKSQHIYILRPVRLQLLTDGPSPQESACLADHADYLDRLSLSGVVLIAGRTQTADHTTFGLVILSESTEEHAVAIMGADPAITGGVMSGELHPYRVAFVSPDISSSVNSDDD